MGYYLLLGTDTIYWPDVRGRPMYQKGSNTALCPVPPTALSLNFIAPWAINPPPRATKVAKTAAAKPPSMNLRSRKASGKASPAKASATSSANAKHTVVAKSGRGKRVTMTLQGGRTVRRVPAPKETPPPPGMKYVGRRVVANFSEEEDQIIRDEVAAGTSQSNIAKMLSSGKEYNRSKGQVRTRAEFLGLTNSSGMTYDMIRPDTELGMKLIPLYHAIKDLQDEGEVVDILQMCRDEGIDNQSTGYRRLNQWLEGKDLPKALLTDKASVARKKSKGKKKAATKKAANTNELESDFY